MAWLHGKGRTRPADLQAAILLAARTGRRAPLPAEPAGEAPARMLPTPDTGTSPRGHGRRGGRAGNGHQSGQSLDALIRDLTPPLPAGQDAWAAPPWGPYRAAVQRWELVLGCPPPPPAEPAPDGRLRLAAPFPEWMMGIPGWVTGITGIPRTAQLRIIGNGAIPQQAAAALDLLVDAATVPEQRAGSCARMRGLA